MPPTTALLQASQRCCLGPVNPQGGPTPGRGTTFLGPQALLADLLVPPTPPQWLQEGPDWESASVACWRAPGMLIHGSQELPVKYAELGYGLCLSL